MWVILCVPLVAAYFEQVLYRHAFDYNPRLSEVLHADDISNSCPPELLAMTHNETYVTQICLSKDVFYDMEVLLNGQVYRMAVDLTSPWSWVKSDQCYQCRKQYTPLQFEQCRVNKSLSCAYDHFNKTYHSTHWQDSTKTAQIYSHEVLVQGKFVTDDLQFLAYNESNVPHSPLHPLVQATQRPIPRTHRNQRDTRHRHCLRTQVPRSQQIHRLRKHTSRRRHRTRLRLHRN